MGMLFLAALVGLGLPFVVSTAVVLSMFPYFREEKRWLRWAKDVGGLTLHSGGGRVPPALTGRVGPVAVKIFHSQGGYAISATPGPGADRFGNELRLERRDDGEKRDDEITTGDRTFDTRVRVFGKLPETTALLDAWTRRLLLKALTELGCEVRDGQVKSFGLSRNPIEGASKRLEIITEVAERLFPENPVEIKARLMKNAAEDPVAEIRAQNLELLIEFYPIDDKILELLRRSVDDDSPAVVGVGAMGLAESGDVDDRESARQTLVSLCLTEPIDRRVRSKAVHALARLYGPNRAAADLEYILVSTAGPLAAPIIGLLERLGFPPSPELMRHRLQHSTVSGICSLVWHLGAADTCYEEVLIPLLKHGSLTVQIEAVRALGVSGTIASIELLLPIARGILSNADLRIVAKEAIRAIQGRDGARHPGGLSLVSGEQSDGHVSLEPDRGSLALTCEDR